MYPKATYACTVNKDILRNVHVSNPINNYQTFSDINNNPQNENKIEVYNQDVCISFFNILAFLILIFCDNCKGEFWISFIALISQTYMISRHMDIIENYLSPSWRAMIMYTMGNVPELFFSNVALVHHKVNIIQESNIGSIISNSLLLFGIVEFINYRYQYNVENKLHISQYTLGILFLLPTVFYRATVANNIPQYIMASFMVVIYITIFAKNDIISKLIYIDSNETSEEEEQNIVDKDFKYKKSLAIVVIYMIAMGYFSNVFIISISDTLETLKCSNMFLNVMIIPIIGNCIEIVTAVKSAYRNNMEVAIYISIGSLLQILWFVYPVTFLLGAIISRPFNLELSNQTSLILSITEITTIFYLLSHCEKSRVEFGMLWTCVLIGGYIILGSIIF